MEPIAAEAIAALFSVEMFWCYIYRKGMRYRLQRRSIIYATPCFSSFEHFVEDIKLGPGSQIEDITWMEEIYDVIYGIWIQSIWYLISIESVEKGTITKVKGKRIQKVNDHLQIAKTDTYVLLHVMINIYLKMVIYDYIGRRWKHLSKAIKKIYESKGL